MSLIEKAILDKHVKLIYSVIADKATWLFKLPYPNTDKGSYKTLIHSELSSYLSNDLLVSISEKISDYVNNESGMLAECNTFYPNTMIQTSEETYTKRLSTNCNCDEKRIVCYYDFYLSRERDGRTGVEHNMVEVKTKSYIDVGINSKITMVTVVELKTIATLKGE